MIEDEGKMRTVKKAFDGLISQADRIVKGGGKLTEEKIEVGVPGGAYQDFCNLVDELKTVNKRYSFGYDSQLESLGAFKVGNWSELVVKCNILSPIADRFCCELQSSRLASIKKESPLI